MIQSNLLQKFNKIRHYYFDKKDSLEKFQIKSSSLVTLEQVHGNKIILINTQKNNYYKSYDGAVTSQSLFLGISTADCLPIFLYDPVKTIIAAVHAGWKGLYLDILKRAMAKINRLGGCPGNLYVGIGPHIRVCCYHVPLSRVLLFEKKQKAHPFSFSVIFNSLWYLDLEKIVLMEML
ncbi:MAG: polyphenol oxidase family protein, partial [Actinobacteria bacterium]|nr:polyphenol oxidase family protein [Actinomycetota bacterium]